MDSDNESSPLQPQTVVGSQGITPMAMAMMSSRFDQAARQYCPSDRGRALVGYYMFCVSIELAGKSAILSLNCTKYLRDTGLRREYGHDLKLVADRVQREFPSFRLDDVERDAVDRMSPLFKGEALEFFTPPMLDHAFRGYRDLPPLECPASASGRFQAFLAEHANFHHVRSTDGSDGGAVTLV